MKNTLIVTANPSVHGFTHKIAYRIEKALLAKWENVEILDLYENRQDFLIYEHMHELKTDENELNEFQKKIKFADEIVFIFPIWWASMPAILKNFIDTNLTPGFAYSYIKWKMLPEPLLKGKQLTVYTTCDSPAFVQYITWFPLKKEIKLTASFVWLKLKKFKLLSYKRKRSDEYLDNFLEQVEKDFT